jgi:effector-binding domain-containing protein
MFKIGEFSKLSRVSVKALRHYDDLGLLRPAHVDRFTSYRYYSAAQLAQLNRILALRDLGLSLEQVRQVLRDGLPAEHLRGMLRLKQAELAQHLAQEQERLQRVAARLQQIEQEGTMPSHEVVIKEVPALRVAALRGVVETYSAQGSLWNQLEAHLQQGGIKPIGPCFTIDHNEEYRPQDVDLEVCEPVDAPLDDTGSVRIYNLPAVSQMASTIHHGSYEGLSAAYQAFMTWIQANGYRIAGPNREIYLRNLADHGVTPDDLVTEMQFPVEKA